MALTPYLVPLFLGMTFDARNTRPGVDIYDLKYVNDPDIKEFGRTTSVYKVTNSMSEIQKALDISGDLSLKIKTGMIDIEGKGSYLKNEREFKNRVEILTTFQYISKVKSLKPDAVPYNNWTNLYNLGVFGTHYVDSITYGAELIASARFIVFNSSDTESVKGDVSAAIGSGGDGVKLAGELDKLNKKVQGKANLEISYYGTVPLKSIANSIEGLTQLISSFEEQINQTNLREGIPMYIGLQPLTNIAPPDEQDKFKFDKSQVLLDELSDFEEQLDDLRSSRLSLTSWAKALPYEIPDEFEKEIGFLLKNITIVSEIFYDVVWKMDLTKGPEQLKTAFDAYDYDGRGTRLRYDKLVRKLIEKLDPKINRGEVASDTYIQWGSSNCSAPGTVLLYDGFTYSSSEDGIGGSARYQCAPRSIAKGYTLSSSSMKSNLAGIRYTALDKASNPFKGDHAKTIPGQGVPCAFCHSPESATVAEFSATEMCPLTWQLMYTGYLMSSRNQYGHTSEYICVDEIPSAPYKMDSQTSSKDTLALTIVHSSGSLPQDPFKQGALVRCVVCAMTSSQVTF